MLVLYLYPIGVMVTKNNAVQINVLVKSVYPRHFTLMRKILYKACNFLQNPIKIFHYNILFKNIQGLLSRLR